MIVCPGESLLHMIYGKPIPIRGEERNRVEVESPIFASSENRQGTGKSQGAHNKRKK